MKRTLQEKKLTCNDSGFARHEKRTEGTIITDASQCHKLNGKVYNSCDVRVCSLCGFVRISSLA